MERGAQEIYSGVTRPHMSILRCAVRFLSSGELRLVEYWRQGDLTEALAFLINDPVAVFGPDQLKPTFDVEELRLRNQVSRYRKSP